MEKENGKDKKKRGKLREKMERSICIGEQVCLILTFGGLIDKQDDPRCRNDAYNGCLRPRTLTSAQGTRTLNRYRLQVAYALVGPHNVIISVLSVVWTPHCGVGGAINLLDLLLKITLFFTHVFLVTKGSKNRRSMRR